MSDDDTVSRRALRHHILRLRNARVAGDQNAATEPRLLMMHSDTLRELLVDGDPAEQRALDWEGREFWGIPVITDDRLAAGTFVVRWPDEPSDVTVEP